MKKFLLFFAALTAAGALSAHAQSITVTTNTTWNSLTNDPLTRVFTSTTGDQSGGVTATNALQQTFTVSEAFSVESFYIRYRQGGNLTLSIFQVADANQPNPLSLGTQVFTTGVTLPNVGNTTTSANLFLDSALELLAGAYAFEFSTLDANTFEWRRTSNAGLTNGVYPGNTYAGGRAYAINPITGSNSNFVNGSSEFALAVVAVPEPTTISLVVASLGALYLGMRRRR